ncbi:MAG: alkaline phosphatase family protein [Thermoanaerobaculia bacterium]
MRRVPVVLALLGLLGTSGCGPRGSGPERHPLLVVGVDGLEWDVLLPLLAAGELPTLAGWIERGRAGLLETFEPTQSPVIWTTVATGKTWRDHGISGFVRRGPDGEAQLLTSLDRRAAALWNMTDHAGLRTAVVGWWMTSPVEPIRGVMVAQTNTLPPRLGGRGRGSRLWKGSVEPGRPGQVHPPELAPRVEEWLGEAEASLDARLEALVAPFPRPMPRFEQRLWTASRWSLRADAVYLRTARSLLEEDEGLDLVLLYLGGPDVLGHRFWRYWRPDEYEHPPDAAARQAFGDVLPAYHRYLDAQLGRLTAQLEGWNVLLLSDHGMRPYQTAGVFDGGPGDGGLSGHHRNAPPGVLIAAGPDIAPAGSGLPGDRTDLPTLGTVFDITPTVLTLLGLPTAEDLVGRPLEPLLVPELRRNDRPKPIPSWDRWFEPAGAAPGAEESPEDERLEQLRSLGYLDGD